MNTNFFRFRLGGWSCISLLDGYMDYPLDTMYANVPKEQVVKTLREQSMPEDKVTTPYTFLVVDSGDHRVLVDMGAGILSPTTGMLPASMREAGVQPEEIDTVIITHAHPDHIGGTLDREGDPYYPNAHYFIQKTEWEFWMTDTPDPHIPEFFFKIAQAQLKPVKDRVTLVEGNTEVLPGVQMIQAPGHTPGHAVASFQSGQEQLMYIGDVVLQPLHLEHPDWLPVFDILPEAASSSKQAVFDLAADCGALVIGQHFPPFPSLGKVTRKGTGWLWTPVAV